MLEELKNYFETTSEEQILADWEKTKQFDEIGISVEDYLEYVESLNESEKQIE